ncbi:MAG: hypothetical protein VX408_07445 [Pseudomonadota bacterium]|uniref:hypothetical protein n=1 Tax=Psychrobacter TaxID=497 RepID=UPI001BAF87BE|nr:hypothetical protein [Psychrobacter sp. UBA2514]MEC9444884.1 hypothetical protein [Pseudomonadota bacterium]MED6316867.1 hypothetical protein [Pseudomonadota bacterium]
MSNYSSELAACPKWRASLKMIGKIAFIVICTGVILALGFWLLMMSNMGPAYLPNICNGCLDIWVRMMLLVVGISLWVLVAAWIIWHILLYLYHLIKHNQ